MPSFLIILLIASILKNFTNNKYFKGFIKGVKPIIVGLISSTGIILLIKSIGYVSRTEFNFDIVSTIIFVSLCVIYFGYKLIFKKKLSTIYLILISAGLGIGINMIL